MKIFITGTAGFIGYHVTKRLIKEGHNVVAIDCINDYYDPEVKYRRLETLGINRKTFKSADPKLTFYREDINDQIVNKLFSTEKFDVAINLAAQAGVRYQFENPMAYVHSNMSGFVNIMEAIRAFPVKHFIYASSSSVYGMNTESVFREDKPVDHPSSLYAASKRANELIAHTYSNLFGIPTTGLRFFTVYGPWGRPDMFMYKLANSVTYRNKLQVYLKNGKSLWRDYTFVEDVVEGIIRLINKPAQTESDIKKPNHSTVPFKVYNIGKGKPDKNNDVIKEIEKNIGKKANLEYVDAPKTEVFKTYASTKALEAAIGYKPKVMLKEGIRRFIEWYKEYYKV